MKSEINEKRDGYEIYLIRHGQTDWNVVRRVQGQQDVPLNEAGKQQAEHLRAKLRNIPFAVVFSSDLSRARMTAEIILDARKNIITETPELREVFWGAWEGSLIKDLDEATKKEGVLLTSSKEYCLSHRWHQSTESYGEVYTRIENFIRSQITSGGGSPMLLSSHGGVLRSVLYTLDFRPGFKWDVGNCGMLKLQATNSGEIFLVGYDGVSLIQDLI
jgi:2,3-bisphosphoglycerate-dependent phosphoglycerate mutase